MDVNDRLALEIGRPSLRAALAETQVETVTALLQQAQAQIESLTVLLDEARAKIAKYEDDDEYATAGPSR